MTSTRNDPVVPGPQTGTASGHWEDAEVRFLFERREAVDSVGAVGSGLLDDTKSMFAGDLWGESEEAIESVEIVSGLSGKNGAIIVAGQLVTGWVVDFR